MQVVILADGDVGPRAAIDAAWPGWRGADPVVIAADGGARHAANLGLTIDRWVGDGDSIGEDDLAALASSGVPIERSRPDKDESDTELALRAALRLDPAAIAIVGATGGARIDHTLANLALLDMDGLAGRDVRLIGADTRIRLLRAPGSDGGPVRLGLAGREGDIVSLLPLGSDALGVRTTGLRYPLHDEPLATGGARGLSNVRIDGAAAAVELRSGRLLVIESPATL